MKKVDSDMIVELIEDSKWVHYIAYAGGALLFIWLLGKSSRILSVSILEFKSLRNAIKQ